MGENPVVEARNVVTVGERIEFMEQSFTTSDFIIDGIEDLGGAAISRANPGNMIQLRLTGNRDGLKKHGIFSRRKTR